MNGLSLDVTITAADGLLSCDLSGETAILHLKSGIYFTMNPLATKVWSLIQEPHSIRSVHNTILECYDVDEETAAHDLLALLAEMREHDLIVVKA